MQMEDYYNVIRLWSTVAHSGETADAQAGGDGQIDVVPNIHNRNPPQLMPADAVQLPTGWHPLSNAINMPKY